MSKELRELLHDLEKNKIITKGYSDKVLGLLERDLARAEEVLHAIISETFNSADNEILH